MNLFANGCSWTWGGGLNLDKPEQQVIRLSKVWPQHLGRILNCNKITNIAQGCGSNQRIFRTTLNWLLNTPQEVLDNTVAVIQWTEPMRFEFYIPKNTNEVFEDYNERWAAVKIDAISTHFYLDNTDIISDTNRMFQFYTPIEGYYKTLSNLEALHSLFVSKNVKYYYWSQDNIFERLPEEKLKIIKKYNWLGEPFNNWHYERVSPTDRHPSINGHKQLAEIISTYILQST